jgi:hypothetical protein
MKKIIYIFIVCIYINVSGLYGATLGGLIELLPAHTGHTEKKILRIYTDTMNYTNGGITFIYPVGFFSAVPVVTISVEILNFGMMNFNVTAVITANSSSSTTVQAFIFNASGVPVEVSTNDIAIHLHAVGST